ncbi:MAG: LamG domain-containing protein [Chitinophagales bacterium]|nr:LamG domain-containing protein [Chitinophagales bacterium]
MAFCLFVFSFCKKEEITTALQNGLVANIELNGNAFDVTNNVSGVIYGAQPFNNRQGEPQQSMYFTRSDSAYIDFGDAPQFSFPNNIFSICCWILVSDTLSPSAILSKRNATGPFEYSIDNHVYRSSFNFDNWIANGNTTVYGVDPLNAVVQFEIGVWQQVSFVADGNVLKVYVNGNFTGSVDSIKAGNNFSDTDASFQIGVGGGYGRYYHFDGAIDDILIYNRVLTQEEIELIASL